MASGSMPPIACCWASPSRAVRSWRAASTRSCEHLDVVGVDGVGRRWRPTGTRCARRRVTCTDARRRPDPRTPWPGSPASSASWSISPPRSGRPVGHASSLMIGGCAQPRRHATRWRSARSSSLARQSSSDSTSSAPGKARLRRSMPTAGIGRARRPAPSTSIASSSAAASAGVAGAGAGRRRRLVAVDDQLEADRPPEVVGQGPPRPRAADSSQRSRWMALGSANRATSPVDRRRSARPPKRALARAGAARPRTRVAPRQGELVAGRACRPGRLASSSSA